MLLSLTYIFLGGMLFSYTANLLRIPRIIGMIVAGILLGPMGFQLLSDELLSVSGEFRTLALLVILLKAGLSLRITDIKSLGRPVVGMAFLPSALEIVTLASLSHWLFQLSWVEGFLFGAVVCAVSPAVVVYRMTELIKEKYGVKKGVPQLLLAGSALDDIIVVTIFGVLLDFINGNMTLWQVVEEFPIAIAMGLLLGAVAGYMGWRLFTIWKPTNIMSAGIVLVGLSVGLMNLGTYLGHWVPTSGLLAVMVMATLVRTLSQVDVGEHISKSISVLWGPTEILLFVLVGAAINIPYIAMAGATLVLLLALGLGARSLGVLLSVSGSQLNKKERLYTIVSYWPKASVQAAIGGIPLTMGLSSGHLILTAAVLAIVITTPIGAVLMEKSYKRLLEKN
ncbi:sodium:proton antiporter [uncultured Veillonella sp.]|uniref:cation:proton antiporter n=1 Tax=uncultured Veillonella sp. TaxID=159268 RepID=UPI0025D34529|nr:cation:proton antiporter [uncultured Veillonella sp.]MDY3973896.1 cation:proton antiporter [Veillonella caviae]